MLLWPEHVPERARYGLRGGSQTPEAGGSPWRVGSSDARGWKGCRRGSRQCSRREVPRAIAPCTWCDGSRRGCPALLDIILLLPSWDSHGNAGSSRRSGCQELGLQQIRMAVVGKTSQQTSPCRSRPQPGRSSNAGAATGPMPARGGLEGKTSPVSEASLCKPVLHFPGSETMPLLHREEDREELRSRTHIKGKGVFARQKH